MHANADQIYQFLSTHHPFDQLPEAERRALAGRVNANLFVSGSDLPDDTAGAFHTIYSGAVEVHGAGGELLARLGEGDVFGHEAGLPRHAGHGYRVIEETLLLTLDMGEFRRLAGSYPQFDYFFTPPSAGAFGAATSLDDGGGVNLLTTPVRDMLTRAPVSLPPTADVREAAQLMSREGVSSLLVMADGRLAGIVTDRDLRGRVLAAGRSPDSRLADVMTPDPLTVEHDALAYEALLDMARGGIHHLPVVENGRVAGMITNTDLVQRYSTSPLYLIGDIYRSESVAELVAVSARLSRLLVTLVDANATSHNVGQVISSIGEVITSRLLQLAEAAQGPAPLRYAWLTGGSLARGEQTAHSDQDNCLLLADDYDEARHGAYFERLARFVCDGLDACGYVYCPGEVMAMTPKWRQPLGTWKRYFDAWVERPEPKALMHTCIFFDLRHLYGDAALFAELQEYFVAKAHGNKLFHAYMASNALQFQPPLGFFRNFVLVRDGEHDHTLDLKHRGVVPIIDIARVYALAHAIVPVNTRERLRAAQESGALSPGGAADLTEALEFIGAIRLRHQARQLRNGGAADNFVAPEELSHFERKHLKDAFAAVRTIQAALAQRYQTARFG